MGQITLYLNAETEQKVKQAAKAAGVSQSKWVATLIQNKTNSEWPESIVSLAGQWADFPSAEELRRTLVKDIERGEL
ncbi:MAG: hypothetical protein ACI9SC_001765 [Gammaproteobacteria bacterium]|jgi:hypothetical protein